MIDVTKELRLVGKRPRWPWVLLVLSTLLSIGGFMVVLFPRETMQGDSDLLMGLLIAALFGVCALVYFFLAITSRRRTLVLSSPGFHDSNVSTGFIPWSTVRQITKASFFGWSVVLVKLERDKIKQKHLVLRKGLLSWLRTTFNRVTGRSVSIISDDVVVVRGCRLPMRSAELMQAFQAYFNAWRSVPQEPKSACARFAPDIDVTREMTITASSFRILLGALFCFVMTIVSFVNIFSDAGFWMQVVSWFSAIVLGAFTVYFLIFSLPSFRPRVMLSPQGFMYNKEMLSPVYWGEVLMLNDWSMVGQSKIIVKVTKEARQRCETRFSRLMRIANKAFGVDGFAVPFAAFPINSDDLMATFEAYFRAYGVRPDDPERTGNNA